MTEQPRAGDLPSKDDVVDVLSGQHRTGIIESDVPRAREFLTRVVGAGLREAHADTRAVAEIRRWMAYEQHLIDTCDRAECPGCGTRESMLARLAALLPALPETSRRADRRGR